jgi:hypothetical protein
VNIDRDERADHPAGCRLQHGEEEVIFAAEEIVQRRQTDGRLAGNLADRSIVPYYEDA